MYSNLSHSSITFRFTKRFLTALNRLNQSNPSESNREVAARRLKKIKAAADKSLARSVGSRRLWSRAILHASASKLRRKRRGSVVRRRLVIGGRRYFGAGAGEKRRRLKRKRVLNGGQADELRKLIPGGEEMGNCRLLEEVAHYMLCLKTQVVVMKCIADLCSQN